MMIPSLRNLYFIIICFALPLLSHPVFAHNGAVAVALPMGDITLDGDLGDWPKNLPHYPIAIPELWPVGQGKRVSRWLAELMCKFPKT